LHSRKLFSSKPLLDKQQSMILSPAVIDLIDFTYTTACSMYGEHRLSSEHKALLKHAATTLATSASDKPKRSFRNAVPLPVGGGKTLLIKAFIKAIHELELPLSILIAASEIKALCQVYDSLTQEHGVSSEKIGIFHYKDDADIASTPEELLSSKQFLLCSHSMIRTEDRHVDPCLSG
jgi:hypothetical protein